MKINRKEPAQAIRTCGSRQVAAVYISIVDATETLRIVHLMFAGQKLSCREPFKLRDEGKPCCQSKAFFLTRF